MEEAYVVPDAEAESGDTYETEGSPVNRVEQVKQRLCVHKCDIHI